jgi:hypothetical protein
MERILSEAERRRAVCDLRRRVWRRRADMFLTGALVLAMLALPVVAVIGWVY